MPKVSVIVPCYNEETTIRLLLESISEQTFPKNSIEVVIADGNSTDNTRQEIHQFCTENPDLKVTIVDNPVRNIPAGLNTAIRAARGEIIVRLDAHSMPAADYIERSVNALQAGLGQNVGGVWEIHPGSPTWVSRSIASAASHPLGVGDALYRYSNQAGEVDTVPFGSFYRVLIEKIGLFDEKLLTNEDYEFNTRIRLAGGKVYLDPMIRSVYFSRPTLAALGRQYWRYGFWKQRMLRRYPGTLRWRQALPPVFVLSLLGLFSLGFLWTGFWWLLLAQILVYWSLLSAASIRTAVNKKDLVLMVGMPLAIMTMHLSWGTAFIVSFIRSIFDRKA